MTDITHCPEPDDLSPDLFVQSEPVPATYIVRTVADGYVVTIAFADGEVWFDASGPAFRTLIAAIEWAEICATPTDTVVVAEFRS